MAARSPAALRASMDIVVAEDQRELDARGTQIVLDWLRDEPDALVGPALGNSPLGIYRGRATAHANGAFDASALRIAQLDEYFGIAADDPRALRNWLQRVFLGPLGIDSRRVIGLPSDAVDAEVACAVYAEAVRDGGGI